MRELIIARIKDIGAGYSGDHKWQPGTEIFTEGRWRQFTIQPSDSIEEVPIRKVVWELLPDAWLLLAFERIVRQWSKQM